MSVTVTNSAGISQDLPDSVAAYAPGVWQSAVVVTQ